MRGRTLNTGNEEERGMSFEEREGSEVSKKLWDAKPSIPPLSPEVLWV